VLRLADRDGHAHAAFGLEGMPTLVLVRPDGHLAFSSPVDRPGLLTKYCERVFGPTPACELNVYD
jgi:3-(3-hydroxy-phenyl)propionate hydroxylase